MLLLPSKLYCQYSQSINDSIGWLYKISYINEKDKKNGIKNNESINKVLCKAIRDKDYDIFFKCFLKLKGNTIKVNFNEFDSSLVTKAIFDYSNRNKNTLNKYCMSLYNPLLSNGATDFYKYRKKILFKDFLELFILNIKEK